MTPRQKARLETEARIVTIGNRMLDESGVDGLSLRAIARELGIVSSAVYRYVKNRDELLTLLIAHAYTDLAEAVERSLVADPSVRGIGLSMLAWSRDHPARWALLYGTPIAAYEAPREMTVEPGTRVILSLAKVLAESEMPAATEVRGRPQARMSTAGHQTTADHRTNPDRRTIDTDRTIGASRTEDERLAVARLRGELADLGVAVDVESTVRMLTVWTALLGLVSALRFGQLGPGFDDVEDGLMCALTRSLGVAE